MIIRKKISLSLYLTAKRISNVSCAQIRMCIHPPRCIFLHWSSVHVPIVVQSHQLSLTRVLTVASTEEHFLLRARPGHARGHTGRMGPASTRDAGRRAPRNHRSFSSGMGTTHSTGVSGDADVTTPPEFYVP